MNFTSLLVFTEFSLKDFLPKSPCFPHLNLKGEQDAMANQLLGALIYKKKKKKKLFVTRKIGVRSKEKKLFWWPKMQ